MRANVGVGEGEDEDENEGGDWRVTMTFGARARYNERLLLKTTNLPR